MALDRYGKDPVLNFGAQYGTAQATRIIRQAIASGGMKTTTIILRGFERLDTIASVQYGNGRYWWIIAAASDIGWGLQVPPGTVIKIPRLTDIQTLFS
jgi:nucleoid-associated protein YgaU